MVPVLLMVLHASMPVRAIAQEPDGQADKAPTASKPRQATVEDLFTDFLHYARLGRFTEADAYAKALLLHPELDPVKVLEAAKKDKKSIDTLLIIIKNSSIGESASQVLELIGKGEQEKRQEYERIKDNIQRLGGDPQQEFIATRNLMESGEYAVPTMLQALSDPGQSRLWPRIVSALPKIGKPAVNPLVMGLSATNTDLRLKVIHALGEIGYEQAVPYLQKVAADSSSPREVVEGAARAVARIEALVGRSPSTAAEENFHQLAEKYYDEDATVRCDPRLDQANVWYWEESTQTLSRISASSGLFGPVMAMRCAEEALRIRSDHAEAIGLWLAANARREARLGLNVESGDPAETADADPTRPAVFPRALYFTQAAGPRYVHLMLRRAVKDRDTPVALAAIEALRATAGASSLVGESDETQPLATALQFPDVVVRIRAALALGAALPKSPFPGSGNVVPVLANAVSLTGREQILVVDAEEDNANRVSALMRATGHGVLIATNFHRGMSRARTEFQSLSGVMLATNIVEPDARQAVRELRAEFAFAKTPIVLLRTDQQEAAALDITRQDALVETVSAHSDETELEAAWEAVRARTGQAKMDPALALSLALQATETLRQIAVDGRTVFDLGPAEPALIGALSATEERLATLAASVLALIHSPTAQRAIAHVALDAGNNPSLRIAAYTSLAQSARNHGQMLEEKQISELVQLAQDDKDLTLRTAASLALGAMNLSTNQASEIIRSYYGG